METSIEIVLLVLPAVMEQNWGWTLKFSLSGWVEGALTKCYGPGNTKAQENIILLHCCTIVSVTFTWYHFHGYSCCLVVCQLKECFLRDGLGSKEKHLKQFCYITAFMWYKHIYIYRWDFSQKCEILNRTGTYFWYFILIRKSYKFRCSKKFPKYLLF